MKFTVTYTLKGPAATVQAPNVTNPVEADDLPTLMQALAPNLPNNTELGLEVIGINIQPA